MHQMQHNRFVIWFNLIKIKFILQISFNFSWILQSISSAQKYSKNWSNFLLLTFRLRNKNQLMKFIEKSWVDWKWKIEKDWRYQRQLIICDLVRDSINHRKQDFQMCENCCERILIVLTCYRVDRKRKNNVEWRCFSRLISLILW